MHLNRLSLLNFKNIREAQLDFSPRINCFVGDNGTGKTNLLDAIHYLSMCKSAFGLSDSQCVRHGNEGFVVNGIYSTPTGRNETIVCTYQRGNAKKLSRGGKEYEKLSDHIGLLPIVMIAPSDTALINESGEERRRYLNSLISQLDRDYLSALIRYNHILAERNKLLKNQGTANFNEILEVFDMQLAALGTALHKRRRELIEELAPLAAQAYLKLSEDIFDKLDMQRVEQLIGIVSDERFGQIFITDCNKVRLEGILSGNRCDYTLFSVADGTVAAPQPELSSTGQEP